MNFKNKSAEKILNKVQLYFCSFLHHVFSLSRHTENESNTHTHIQCTFSKKKIELNFVGVLYEYEAIVASPLTSWCLKYVTGKSLNNRLHIIIIWAFLTTEAQLWPKVGYMQNIMIIHL